MYPKKMRCSLPVKLQVSKIEENYGRRERQSVVNRMVHNM